MFLAFSPRRSLKLLFDIGGFNFYYGAVEGNVYRWLDFKTFFTNTTGLSSSHSIYETLRCPDF